MRLIKETPDEFIVELEVEELRWYQKIWLSIYDWWNKKFPWMSYRR